MNDNIGTKKRLIFFYSIKYPGTLIVSGIRTTDGPGHRFSRDITRRLYTRSGNLRNFYMSYYYYSSSSCNMVINSRYIHCLWYCSWNIFNEKLWDSLGHFNGNIKGKMSMSLIPSLSNSLNIFRHLPSRFRSTDNCGVTYRKKTGPYGSVSDPPSFVLCVGLVSRRSFWGGPD